MTDVVSTDLVERWRQASAATPSDWQLMGVTCGSTGLTSEQRSVQWVAQACGPNRECERAEAASAEGALLALTTQLRAR